MININKMSDSEYQEYCLKEYAEFFKQLEKEINKDLKDLKMIYYFEGKTLIVKPTINTSIRENSLFPRKRMLIEGTKIPNKIFWKKYISRRKFICYPYWFKKSR